MGVGVLHHWDLFYNDNHNFVLLEYAIVLGYITEGLNLSTEKVVQ